MSESSTPVSVDLGLNTRHVFLDTEVFKRRGHNLSVQPFPALGDYLAEKNITLHTTDITLRELERQIRADALDLASEIGKTAKRVIAWKHKVPGATLEEIAVPDGASLGTTAWGRFRYTLILHWHVKEHKALAINPTAIFDDYFNRRPPFQENGSKEFPDAFVAAALEQWCEKNNQTMYVVTQDKAFLARAQASDYLLPLSSLEDFLQKVTEAETPQTVETVEALLTEEVGVAAFRQTVRDQFDQLDVHYSGELREGELTDASFNDDVELGEFWIIAKSSNKASVLVKAKIGIDATISYEDVSGAMYDSEDDVYFGAENSDIEIQDTVAARVVLTIDLDTQQIEKGELLPDMVFVEEDLESGYY